MATKTVTIGNSVKLEYFDNKRLYIVIATDMETNEDYIALNLNNDMLEAIAEMEFKGLTDPVFFPLDDYLVQIDREEG
jgi:hypothetical protein